MVLRRCYEAPGLMVVVLSILTSAGRLQCKAGWVREEPHKAPVLSPLDFLPSPVHVHTHTQCSHGCHLPLARMGCLTFLTELPNAFLITICGASGKESACQCRRCRFDPGVGKIPWRRKWLPTAVFRPGKSRGQGGLVGYRPWGHKESDTTESLSTAGLN